MHRTTIFTKGVSPEDCTYILLADDDADDRKFFKDVFAELKMRTIVETVNNGEDLMKHLYTSDITLPDVLFLDLNMPLKNGMECLKEIRQSKKLKYLTVCIYSTSSGAEDIELAFEKGANIFVTKPSDFNDLKDILKEIMSMNWQYKAETLNKEMFVLSL